MEREQTEDDSIVSAYAAVGLFGVALVVAAHPLSAGFALLGAGAVALFARAAWRQVTGRGLSLPGTSGKLRVETDTVRDEREQWTLTVSITEN